MSRAPEWKHHRVIHSRFPPINLFDKDADQNLLLAELEGMTSDRLYMPRAHLLLESDARYGQGWGPVMASFCYIRPGRFNTTDFGAYYCAQSPEVAIAEWSYHAAMVWREHGLTDEASATVRCYSGHFDQPLVDACSNARAHQKLSYKYSQALGVKLRNNQEYGIVYRSVRDPSGLAAALLRPPATKPVKQAAHYSVQWDGTRFTQFAVLGKFVRIAG